MTDSRVKITRAAPPPPEPFEGVEDAWIWCMGMLASRGSNGRLPDTDPQKPCSPQDIVTVLDRLYRQRRVTLEHARILRIWGERGRAPSATVMPERGDYRLWREAMNAMDWPLRVKGIVRSNEQ